MQYTSVEYKVKIYLLFRHALKNGMLVLCNRALTTTTVVNVGTLGIQISQSMYTLPQAIQLLRKTIGSCTL